MVTTMRAVLIKDSAGPAENLFVGETMRPTLSSKEVLVKVRSVSSVSSTSLHPVGLCEFKL